MWVVNVASLRFRQVLLLLLGLMSLSNFTAESFFVQPFAALVSRRHHTPPLPARCRRAPFVAPSLSSTPEDTETTATAATLTTLTPHESQSFMDTVLLPTSEHTARARAGRDAQGLGPSVVVAASDPRMALTYGEFPLESFDALMDRAEMETPGRRKLIDLGSGCGRLVLHAALTRPYEEVVGIEISDLLHGFAVEALERGISEGAFSILASSISDEGIGPSVSFHLGPADQYTGLLAEADVIFAYSTVWPDHGFSEHIGAMILGKEWSELLAHACQNGCVVVTTDRALDPRYGWDIVDRMDVANPDLMGSTGFINVLRK